MKVPKLTCAFQSIAPLKCLSSRSKIKMGREQMTEASRPPPSFTSSNCWSY
ncbi:hypothetical protein Scep_021433 [Stephania cephalantha]|uniref:Uncharacterized protein n=1 Tax=Stephania cephalantha TaxID=152367 RepID=A0AAP0FDN8_9MAGN